MRFERRLFVTVAVAGASLNVIPGAFRTVISPAERLLKILILGGTGFLGPHTVNYALERGHAVTLFNRGKTI